MTACHEIPSQLRERLGLPAPKTKAAKRRQYDRLTEALMELPAVQTFVCCLRFGIGEPGAKAKERSEIASAIGCNEAAVGILENWSVRRLRKAMREGGR